MKKTVFFIFFVALTALIFYFVSQGTIKFPHIMQQNTFDIEEASDVESAESYQSYQYDPNDPYCIREELQTEILQNQAYNFFANSRENRETLSPAQERDLGASVHQALSERPDSEFLGKIDNHPEELSYLNSLIQTLLPLLDRPDVTYTIHIVDDEVANAFAVPGGHLYVNTGLLRDRERIQNEAQLMGILAHEIGHNDLRHTTAAFETIRELGIDGTPSEMPILALMRLTRAPYSSTLEDEADRYAVDRLIRSEYSPYQFELLWRNWDEISQRNTARTGQENPVGNNPVDRFLRELENVLQTHNPHSQRACNIREEIQGHNLESDQMFYVGQLNLERFISRNEEVF